MRGVQRGSFWPFDRKRLVSVLALRKALVYCALAMIARVIIAHLLPLSDEEIHFWRGTIFAPALARPLLIRLPGLCGAALGIFWLVRLATKMGWAKGTDIIALLGLITPLFIFAGLTTPTTLLFFGLWAGVMESSYVAGTDILAEKFTRHSLIRPSFLGALALALDAQAIYAVLASGLWLGWAYRQKHAREKKARALARTLPSTWLLAPVPVGITAGVAGSLAWPQSIGNALTFSASQIFLLGPALICGAYFLLDHGLRNRANGSRALAGERINLEFLQLWLGAALPFFVFSIPGRAAVLYAPVLVYFAKLSASESKPRFLRFTRSSSLLLSLLAIAIFVTARLT